MWFDGYGRGHSDKNFEVGIMTENGISKKVFIATIGVQGIITMADGAEEKFRYALLVAGVIVFYKVLQFLIDWRNNGKTEKS